MRLFPKSGRPSRMQHLFVVLYAVAVLCWGSGYKFSLYYSPSQTPAQLTPAKLLSEKERPPQHKRNCVEASPSRARIALRSSAPDFAASETGDFLSLPTSGIATLPGSPRSFFETAWHTHFFFRPPPAQNQFPHALNRARKILRSSVHDPHVDDLRLYKSLHK